MYKVALLALLCAFSSLSQGAFASPLEGGRVMLMAKRNMMTTRKIQYGYWIDGKGYDRWNELVSTSEFSIMMNIPLDGTRMIQYHTEFQNLWRWKGYDKNGNEVISTPINNGGQHKVPDEVVMANFTCKTSYKSQFWLRYADGEYIVRNGVLV